MTIANQMTQVFLITEKRICLMNASGIISRGRHKTMKSRIPDPRLWNRGRIPVPPDPLLWNLARIPVPPGSPLVEASPDSSTPRIPSSGTEAGSPVHSDPL